MKTLISAWDFAKQNGWTGIVILLGFALLLVIWKLLQILLDEDRSALARGQVFKVLHRLSGRIDQEKKFISNDIKGRLNLARRKLSVGHNTPAKAVDVVWREGAVGESRDIREGEFVVCLCPSSIQEKNIALLASAVVKRTTLLGIRHSVEQPLQDAIDLNLARHLLEQARTRAALDWFLVNEYVPTLQRDSAVAARNRQIVSIDERGLFTRVLLVELDEFARRIHGKPPRPYMAGEVEGLVEFLYKIAAKQFGQDVPLEFLRAHIRVFFILVAKTHKLQKTIAPYVKAMQIGLEKQFYSIYVLVFDKEWLGEVNPKARDNFRAQVARLASELETGTIATKDFDLEYSCVDQDGNKRTAKCIRYVGPEG